MRKPASWPGTESGPFERRVRLRSVSMDVDAETT
jgi:hypothetical protein